MGRSDKGICLKAREKTFGRDETIFREGEASDAVYLVVSGRVEISKQGPEGPVILSELGPLEMFGEMGILDDSARSTSARALEKTRVKIIPKSDFKSWLKSEPDAAMRVMNVLVERLRAADAVIARQRETQTMIASTTAKFSVLDALMTWFRRRKAPPATVLLTADEVPVQPFVIVVAPVNNDIEFGWTRALMGLLENRNGIAVRQGQTSLVMEPGADQAQAAAAFMRARQALAREGVADLLVWGDVHADGFSLWFTGTGLPDDDRPGSFGPFLRLELPPDQEQMTGDLLALSCLAAIEPMTEAQRALQRQLLPQALQALPDFALSLPVAWNMEQQRTALTCYGHAAATIASWEADPDWFDHAAAAYEAAAHRLGQSAHGVEEAVLRRHLAGALMASGEKRKDAALLERAAGEYRTAVECLMRASYPLEWASAQNRLGLALYKLDLQTGQTDVLKEAMQAFQMALTVFTRAEVPQRWADVMNNLALVLQVYGDQMKSPEVLDRAIDAIRAALEIRNRERTPMAWAACQNTLGTALFLHDKHAQSTENLDAAGDAFNAAAQVYQRLGAGRLAAVAEKNLAHVNNLLKLRAERKVVSPDWWDNDKGA